MKIAAVQMISGPDVAPNLATAGRLVAEAAAAGAQLVALPEYFPLIGATDADRLAARELEGRDRSRISWRQLRAGTASGWSAARFRCWPGTRPSCATAAWFSTRRGRAWRATTRSTCSASKGAESPTTKRPPSSAATRSWPSTRRSGASASPSATTCVSGTLPRHGRPVDLLVLPAAFTETTGRAHWEMLLRARAVENQCYVLAGAQGGPHPNGRMTHGNSMVIDPWGEVLARMDKGEGVVVADSIRNAWSTPAPACRP
jgi:hypothetical protein